ncbi:MAG: TadE/TadG family type IV pilus assembly protein [Planctomycetaceae bacterium]|nr:TadE/TadG family type IV pilus assembly protein [Planctomycetaceae bacterium]
MDKPPPTNVASRSRRTIRCGAAIVELALVVPLLATVVVGVCEVGQVMRVHAILTDAARKGCAAGCQVGGSNASITAEVQDVLAACGLPTDATVVVTVNDEAGTAAAATRNDKVSVRVSIPTGTATWTGSFVFFAGASLRSEEVVMLKQG